MMVIAQFADLIPCLDCIHQSIARFFVLPLQLQIAICAGGSCVGTLVEIWMD
jgi:hypothetical protein